VSQVGMLSDVLTEMSTVFGDSGVSYLYRMVWNGTPMSPGSNIMFNVTRPRVHSEVASIDD